IAVSTDDGLVVPVVRDADKLDFAGVEKEIKELGTKANEKKLTMDELQGGSFTITNGGIFGSMMSTPILNAPQDRKSTRLNSSHVSISYAVFCLKKKKKTYIQ